VPKRPVDTLRDMGTKARTGGEQRARHDAKLAPDLESSLRDALALHPEIRWAYLFGSCARAEPFRDIDVAVMLSPGARGAVALGKIVNRAETAARGVPVDVVDLAAVAPALAGRVVREGRLLVDREREARRAWETAANQRALDIEPWLAEAERLRNEALRQRAG
jgi:predicted nucleotidyltransferase